MFHMELMFYVGVNFIWHIHTKQPHQKLTDSFYFHNRCHGHKTAYTVDIDKLTIVNFIAIKHIYSFISNHVSKSVFLSQNLNYALNKLNACTVLICKFSV